MESWKRVITVQLTNLLRTIYCLWSSLSYSDLTLTCQALLSSTCLHSCDEPSGQQPAPAAFGACPLRLPEGPPVYTVASRWLPASCKRCNPLRIAALSRVQPSEGKHCCFPNAILQAKQGCIKDGRSHSLGQTHQGPEAKIYKLI